MASAAETPTIAEERRRVDHSKQSAMRALEEAADFDETVASVSDGALAFLVAGTVLRAVAAWRGKGA